MTGVAGALPVDRRLETARRVRRKRIVRRDHVGLREVLPGHLDALDEQIRRFPSLQGELVGDVLRLVLLHLREVELQGRVELRRCREGDVGDVEVDALHEALVRVQGRLVVTTEPQLGHVGQPILLNGPGHRHVPLDVHAAHDHVGTGLLHALHVCGDGRSWVADLEVGIAHGVAGGLQRVLLRLARGRRGGHAVGDEGDGRLLLRLSRHIADLRARGGVVLHRAGRGEQVLRPAPVPGDVVAIGRYPRLDEEVGREERRRHAGHGKHVILIDKRVRQLVERRRVPTVVQGVLVVDHATVHPTLSVDVVVVRPLAVDHGREVGRQGPGLGSDRPHRDGVRRHPRCRARRRCGARRAGRRRHDGGTQH